MKYLSKQETDKIIEKLKSGSSINSIRNQTNKSVSFIKRLCEENSIPIVNRQSKKGLVKENFVQVFTKNSKASNCRINNCIKRHNIIPHNFCYNCGIDNWLGKLIVLELDHINGDNTDNRIENLRFLCPNCHSQTSTYKGKNINSGKTKVTDKQLIQALTAEKNIRKALIKVGLSPKGANYERAYKLNDHNKT